jgi:hypothetical protein
MLQKKIRRWLSVSLMLVAGCLLLAQPAYAQSQALTGTFVLRQSDIQGECNANRFSDAPETGGAFTLTLDANRYLSSLQNPAGEAYQFSYENNLLRFQQSPTGARSEYQYDADGRLQRLCALTIAADASPRPIGPPGGPRTAER